MKTIGKYRVIGLVGRGAMGEVVAAEDPDIGRRVAIKVMTPSGEESRERFAREARIIGRLSHPNIVVVHDFGIQDERPFLVMELLEGVDLKRWIETLHPLPEQARIIAELCAAVSYAHRQGVLHRDIKPANVRVLPSGHCKLMDFGVARSEVSDLTASGTVLGTLIYMAPEILSNHPPTPSSDIYAVGMICYEMLTGANPFVASSLAACLNLVLHETPPPLRDRRPDLPSELTGAVMACLAKDPAARAPSLDQLAVAATAISEGGNSAAYSGQPAPPQTHVTTVLERPTTAQDSGAHRRPLRGVAAMVVTALALVAGARLTGFWPTRPDPASGLSSQPSPGVVPSGAIVDVPPGRNTPTPTDPQHLRSTLPVPDGVSRTEGSQSRITVPTMGPTSTPSPRPPPATSTRAPTTASTLLPTLPPESTATAAPPPPPADPEPRRRETATPVVATPGLTLVTAEPHSVRAGRAVRLRLAGSGFGPGMRVSVLRGRREASGFDLSPVRVLDANHVEVDIVIDRDIPLGGYALVAIAADGRRSNRLEVDVNL